MIKSLGLAVFVFFCAMGSNAQERLIYHDIKVDSKGQIIPWYAADPGKSYDHVISLVWNFWDTMRVDMNGIPYYMNHQVWNSEANDPRGLGGDQIQMALSAWQLLYMYSGSDRVKENMKFLADYYLTHGLSPSTAAWPNIPFPYNTLNYSGLYDGDMVIGKDYTQPDKAGSLGIELVKLFKLMSNERYPHATEKRYLSAAVDIANTLAAKIEAGDENNSPWPFKVNAYTGEVGPMSGANGKTLLSSYTTNWAGTAEMFDELIKLKQGDVVRYRKAFDTVLSWMKKYPMKNNKWGPFFEDIPGWSDTQINAMTWARFIMTHREHFPDWKKDVQSIIDWVYKTLGNENWKKYGVTVINEQTAYLNPGNSHTSRQAADELLFGQLTGDMSRKEHAIRQLNWATYMVDTDGKNRYPNDENWLTDGYGDYVRHYIRAMGVAPELTPPGENHIVYSSSIVQNVHHDRDIDGKKALYYTTYDPSGTETVRLTKKPAEVLIENQKTKEGSTGSVNRFSWKPLDDGGILTIVREKGSRVAIVH
jgi:hypothetical protein